MVSSLYAVLGALLLLRLSLNVVKLRNQYRIGYGDGGFMNYKPPSAFMVMPSNTFPLL